MEDFIDNTQSLLLSEKRESYNTEISYERESRVINSKTHSKIQRSFLKNSVIKRDSNESDNLKQSIFEKIDMKVKEFIDNSKVKDD